jgi:beta-xylosidase
MLKTDAVTIRDPFVLPYQGNYYLYGTRSATAWGPADGFDCYVSENLKDWDGPIEIFKRPEGFFADRNYWAPECIYYRDTFFLITTLGCENKKKGIYILSAKEPTGPFTPYSERITPEDWTCIDGTVYFENGTPWLVYSKSFEDSPEGYMYAQPLKEDLSASSGEPVMLFEAKEASWAHPVPFAKAEFGIDGDCYFTDGPGLFSDSGSLYMTWSSWGTAGYTVGLCVSESGKVTGPWKQIDTPVWPENGGHGMTFSSFTGERLFTLHYPNDATKEHPVFAKLIKQGEGFALEMKEAYLSNG